MYLRPYGMRTVIHTCPGAVSVVQNLYSHNHLHISTTKTLLSDTGRAGLRNSVFGKL